MYEFEENAIPSPPWRGNCSLCQPVKLCFHARPSDSLPPLLGLRPATKGSYLLGTSTAFFQTLLSLSAPAELGILNPTADPYFILIRISHLWNCRAQYILGVRQCRIPLKEGWGRLG
jgi:hypothetical protein